MAKLLCIAPCARGATKYALDLVIVPWNMGSVLWGPLVAACIAMGGGTSDIGIAIIGTNKYGGANPHDRLIFLPAACHVFWCRGAKGQNT